MLHAYKVYIACLYVAVAGLGINLYTFLTILSYVDTKNKQTRRAVKS